MAIGPEIRIVNALNGEMAARPSRFVQALSEADSFVQDLDRVRELQTRVDELTAERDEWRQRALKRSPQMPPCACPRCAE